MTIRVLVNGASGKMGLAAVNAIKLDPALTLVGETGRNNNLATEIKQSNANVVVDFTNAESVLKNTLTILDTGARPVVGTSGLKQDQVKELQQHAASLQTGGVIAPNFSLGAILMMKYAQEIAKFFPDVEIIEMHHPGKLDSPSGTAIRTAELISAARQAIQPQNNTRETVKGARGATYQNIPIHAIRLPGLIAHQEIIFGGTGETLKIVHDSIDRQCFMPGVLLACKKVMELKSLVYGLENLIS